MELKIVETTGEREAITTPEASRRSGFTGSYLARLIKRGKLQGFRAGRDLFIYADSLTEYQSKPHKRGPQPGQRKGIA